MNWKRLDVWIIVTVPPLAPHGNGSFLKLNAMYETFVTNKRGVYLSFPFSFFSEGSDKGRKDRH